MAPKTILAADIGGTHSRFALFSLDASSAFPLGGLRLVRRVRFPTAQSTNTAHMMRIVADTAAEDGGYLLPTSPRPVRIDAAVLAIPGPAPVADISAPMQEDLFHCPNIAWPLEVTPVMEAVGTSSVRCINDFAANGFACAMLPHILDAVTILPGEERPHCPRAVIGAGTGLGHCLILPGTPPVVVGSEAGHTLFPFLAGEEAISRHLAVCAGTDRVENEMVVAGNALADIYAYYTGETVHPHKVAPLAAEHADVMETIARFYGRAVLHYALNTLPLGGIFITGGLAANLPAVLTHPAFAREIRETSPMTAHLGTFPIRHVRNASLGLWGAAAYAALLPGMR